MGLFRELGNKIWHCSSWQRENTQNWPVFIFVIQQRSKMPESPQKTVQLRKNEKQNRLASDTFVTSHLSTEASMEASTSFMEVVEASME